MSDSLINRYRPVSFEQVYGNSDIITKLQLNITAPGRSHAFLITGPSGVGKTTVARLIGAALGAAITELDAASHSGVDDMRAVAEISQYMSLQGDGNCMYIIDECHTLSRNAWQALLKLTEEPPDHFYIALCTTEPTKVPDTIRMQRAYQVTLRPIRANEMEAYVAAICEAENWSIPDDVFTLIVQNAEGSPRKALQLLHQLADAPNRDVARQLISTIGAEDPMVKVAQLLLRGKQSWGTLRPLLVQVEDDAFDAAIGYLGNYLVSVLCRTNNTSEMARIADLITALTFPTDTYNKKLHFYAAIARMVQA